MFRALAAERAGEPMTSSHSPPDEAMAEAGAWLARLGRDDASPDDGLVFDAWLGAAPQNRAAYHRLLSLMQEFETHAGDVAAQLAGQLNPAAARRPVGVEAGGRFVRDVGTQFAVRERAGRLTVTVARGRVEVGPNPAAAPGQDILLGPGQRLEIGPTGDPQLTVVDPQETFSWRS